VLFVDLLPLSLLPLRDCLFLHLVDDARVGIGGRFLYILGGGVKGLGGWLFVVERQMWAFACMWHYQGHF
jgi:hypothetical protein